MTGSGSFVDEEQSSLRQTVRQALHERGLRCTEVRMRVLESVAAAPGHLTVAEIHHQIEADLAGVELSTVYRTVITLQDLGLIHRLDVTDQSATYGLAHRPHHHAVCTSCGALTEVPATALAGVVDLAERASGYTLSHDASLQLHGLCANCQRSAAGAPA